MATLPDSALAEHPLLTRSLVLIGMPGSGKSTIGRELATRLHVPFVDSDQEVETAAGMTIPMIFEKLGEPAFREGERKVIARLLNGPPVVLSTGGGAFMNEQTRALIKKEALSLWLRADLDVLVERTSRTNDRPLLRGGDPREILRNLMKLREPVYALADLHVTSESVPVSVTAHKALDVIRDYSQRSL